MFRPSGLGEHMTKLDKKSLPEESFVSKKCPKCYTYIPLDAMICPSCKGKVGRVDRHGMASKRFDWASYLICFIAWLTFAVYVWFAFF
jgi:hypothetical protein